MIFPSSIVQGSATHVPAALHGHADQSENRQDRNGSGVAPPHQNIPLKGDIAPFSNTVFAKI